MSIAQEQSSPRRKRRRAEAESLDYPSESLPSKRQKLCIKLHSAEFYDSLTKVWLTPRALKELNRRTSQANCPPRPASVPRAINEEDLDESNKEIKRFARHGGPDLRDLRGYLMSPTKSSRGRRKQTNSSASSEVTNAVNSSESSGGNSHTQSTAPTSRSGKTGRSSAYDNNFEQKLIEHGIYPAGYYYHDDGGTPEPGNLEELYKILAQPRRSLSPSKFGKSQFKGFQMKNDRAISEGKVMSTVLPVVYGNADVPSEGDLVFTRLAPIADGTTVDAKPDIYDGAHAEDVVEKVREDLAHLIIPTGHARAPVVPSFFLEAKPPKGGADVAKRQACYDGALGARAMHALQSYKAEQVYDGNAYTISSTYHDGTLKMYAHHPTEGPENTTEYNMTQINTWGLTGNPDTFRQGAAAFRNARDWARQQRDKFITIANERAESINAVSSRHKPLNHNISNISYAQNTTYYAKDNEDESRYYMSQQDFEQGYNIEPSGFVYDSDDLSDTTVVQRFNEPELSSQNGRAGTELSAFESPDYNGSSDSPVAHGAESETSADELALDIYIKPKVSSKRRNAALERSIAKAPRHSGKSERSESTKSRPSPLDDSAGNLKKGSSRRQPRISHERGKSKSTSSGKGKDG